jgi:hypothetical protein
VVDGIPGKETDEPPSPRVGGSADVYSTPTGGVMGRSVARLTTSVVDVFASEVDGVIFMVNRCKYDDLKYVLEHAKSVPRGIPVCVLLNFRDCDSPSSLMVEKVWKEVNSVLSAITVHGATSKAEVLDGDKGLTVAFGKPILHVFETSMSNCFGLKEVR